MYNIYFKQKLVKNSNGWDSNCWLNIQSMEKLKFETPNKNLSRGREADLTWDLWITSPATKSLARAHNLDLYNINILPPQHLEPAFQGCDN